MDIKTILGLSSAMVGAGIVVGGQDPSFDYPPLQPVFNASNGSKAEETAPQDKRVTVRFKQASADEVLDWLSNQGVNFVTAGIPKDAKVDLNVKNVPVQEVIDVLGEAFGGSFTKRGNTYVFQPGMRRFAFDGAMQPMPKIEGFRGLESVPKMEELRAFGMQDPKAQKELHEKMMKEFGPNSDFMKKLQKEMGDPKKWEQMHKGFEGMEFKKLDPKEFEKLQKEMQKLHGKEFKAFELDAKKMEELHKLRSKDFKVFEMDAKKMEEFSKLHGQDAKKWEQFGKDMEKRFGPGSPFEKNMKLWEEKHGKEMHKQFGPGSEFQKKMELWGKEHGKEMEKRFGPGSDFAKEMKAFKLENGKMRELSTQEREKMMKDLEVRMKSLKDLKIPTIPTMPKMPAMPRMEGNFFPQDFNRGGDISELAKTLTPAQREKNRKQGFLYWSDLTKEQQAQLGANGWSGSWTVTYSKGGETFTIKSDK